MQVLYRRVAILLVYLGFSTSSAWSIPLPSSDWSLRDIVEAPAIVAVSGAGDGNAVAYVARRSNLTTNRVDYELHIVSVSNREDRIVATSPWLGMLRNMPRDRGWSVLGDFGNGVQLYGFDVRGMRRIVADNPTPALVGNVDGAIAGGAGDPPLEFGILSYDWSPDGKMLFYTTLRRVRSEAGPLSGEAAIQAGEHRRWEPEGKIDYFVRIETGQDILLSTRPASDRTARYLGGSPLWSGQALEFATTDETGREERWQWLPGDTQSNRLKADEEVSPTFVGPRGGALAMIGFGPKRHLIEQTRTADRFDYGYVDATLSDPRSPGIWRSGSGKVVFVAVRLIGEARYAVIRLDQAGVVRLISAPGSLTNCSFNVDRDLGFCVQEGLAIPPRLVAVKHGGRLIEPVLNLAPRYNALRSFSVIARHWTNKDGYRSSGFLITPKNFKRGTRYPLIIVVHGSDADQRFLASDIEWNYPIQVFAQRGYVVALVNDPSPMQNADILEAYVAWSNCGLTVAPKSVQDLIWIEGASTYETVVSELDREGIVDRERVGIAGYSRGSQMVNVVMTQSQIFKAASSGDGAYLEPAAYQYNQCGYRAIYGGSPADLESYAFYRRLAPSYRAEHVAGAILQQMAEPRTGATDFYQSLLAAHVPTRITLYRGESEAADETHMFHIPANKMLAMTENLCWFDFWLKVETKTAGECSRYDYNEVAVGAHPKIGAGASRRTPPR